MRYCMIAFLTSCIDSKCNPIPHFALKSPSESYASLLVSDNHKISGWAMSRPKQMVTPFKFLARFGSNKGTWIVTCLVLVSFKTDSLLISFSRDVSFKWRPGKLKYYPSPQPPKEKKTSIKSIVWMVSSVWHLFSMFDSALDPGYYLHGNYGIHSLTTPEIGPTGSLCKVEFYYYMSNATRQLSLIVSVDTDDVLFTVFGDDVTPGEWHYAAATIGEYTYTIQVRFAWFMLQLKVCIF